METVAALPANALEASKQIIDLAEAKGARIRLLGGVAFKAVCPSASDPRFTRENKDIDLIGRREDTKKIVRLMEELGYKPREVFNKLNMGQRLIYYDVANRRRIDIFFDEFQMCHKFNFRSALLPGTYTLPVTELLMTKLQVIEMTEKEHRDLLALFHDFDVTEGETGIDGLKIAGLCSKDWGLYATFTRSLSSVRARAEDLGGVEVERIDRLKRMIEAEPKTLAWRLRARIGEKAKWYELPESDGDAMLG